MAVDLVHLPAEGLPLVAQRFHADHVVDLAVELVAVAVDDGDQARQLVVRGEQRRFPHLPFLHLAIAQHHEHVEVSLAHAAAQGHAGAVGERVADGAGTEIDARHLGHVGVVAQRAAQAGVAVQQFMRDEAMVDQHREQPHRGVALAHQEAVAVRPGRLARPQPHHVVIQRGKDLGARKDRAVVPDLGDLDQPDGFQPDVAGLFPQHPDLVFAWVSPVLAHGVSFAYQNI